MKYVRINVSLKLLVSKYCYKSTASWFLFQQTVMVKSCFVILNTLSMTKGSFSRIKQVHIGILFIIFGYYCRFQHAKR